ncbi:V-type ATP synthase subunit E [Candidatus Poribacteria bacterium]|nr:V-type ATP synthase subunit E [Candidatus Poribacteria bacterium]
MALEDILRKIEEDARREADKILSEARARAEEILHSAEQEAERIRENLLEEARREAQTHKSRLISMAQLDMRKEILQEKQNLIDQVFQIALERLLRMEDEEYRELIREMLKQVVEHGDEEIILCERDKSRISQGFIQTLNKELESEGKPGKLTIAEETGDFSGGFILRRGKIELNNSFDALLQAAKDEMRSELSQILFGE